jgi:hypothetical protein
MKNDLIKNLEISIACDGWTNTIVDINWPFGFK